MSIISSNIKYLRNKKGISQTALADAVSLKRGNIASYEKELAQPGVDNLIKLADYFKVDLNEFIKIDLSDINNSDLNHPKKIGKDHDLFQGLMDRVTALKGQPDKHSKVSKLKKQNEEIFKMVDGFKAFHNHRIKTLDPFNDAAKKIASDYDNIIDLLETVLNSNKELIKLIEK